MKWLVYRLYVQFILFFNISLSHIFINHVA
uniref:Uncharacterized protein n=1 Tax=Lepeophtheirus salmonis TaxID=72036 RepID=A0A0K2V0J2_LEPSM